MIDKLFPKNIKLAFGVLLWGASSLFAGQSWALEMQCPVAGPFTCPSGVYRNIGSSPHIGTDIGVGTGTPFGSVADGVVGQCYDLGRGCRFAVDVTHAEGLSSRYIHMMSCSGVPPAGTPVTIGQIIGSSGSPTTGCGSGPHLHFDFKQNGARVYPFERTVFGQSYYGRRGCASGLRCSANLSGSLSGGMAGESTFGGGSGGGGAAGPTAPFESSEYVACFKGMQDAIAKGAAYARSTDATVTLAVMQESGIDLGGGTGGGGTGGGGTGGGGTGGGGTGGGGTGGGGTGGGGTGGGGTGGGGTGGGGTGGGGTGGGGTGGGGTVTSDKSITGMSCVDQLIDSYVRQVSILFDPSTFINSIQQQIERFTCQEKEDDAAYQFAIAQTYFLKTFDVDMNTFKPSERFDPLTVGAGSREGDGAKIHGQKIHGTLYGNADPADDANGVPEIRAGTEAPYEGNCITVDTFVPAYTECVNDFSRCTTKVKVCLFLDENGRNGRGRTMRECYIDANNPQTQDCWRSFLNK